MSWIKTEFSFPTRRIVVLITEMDMVGGVLRRLSMASADCPEMLEPYFRMLIDDRCPKLENFSLYTINFDYARMGYLIGIAHPALPSVEAGSESATVRLEDLKGVELRSLEPAHDRT